MLPALLPLLPPHYRLLGIVAGNYEARGASGKKYKAQIVIFCILVAVNRFSWISWKVGKPLKKVRNPLKKAESCWRKWKAIEESGKPLKKVESRLGKIGFRVRKIGF
jgi:hypothetical protein